jgi:D-amino-acid dehydrogenase
MASRACFEQLQSRPDGAFGLAQNGLLMLCQSQHALDEEAAGAAKARDLGIPAEVLDAAQTAKLDPGVRMNVAGSVYYPKDCHLAPSRFMAALRRHLDAAKTKFLWETEVTGCRTESGKILALATNRGEVSAEEYVLAGGIWSSGLSAGLGLRLPMQAGKGYSLTLPQPRELPRICSILTEARIAVTPMDGKLRVGGTMEISGLSEQVSPRRVQGIINAFPRYFPNFKTEDFRDLPVWHGLRPCSPDGLPYIGRPKKFSNLVVAAGHAMMGLSLGPVTGKLVAELLSGEKPSINLSLLKPDRY